MIRLNLIDKNLMLHQCLIKSNKNANNEMVIVFQHLSGVLPASILSVQIVKKIPEISQSAKKNCLTNLHNQSLLLTYI